MSRLQGHLDSFRPGCSLDGPHWQTSSRPSIGCWIQRAGHTAKSMQSYLCMMAVRLLELRRVLKDTGSIYLHCDPTASHYLKLLMDAVFGVRPVLERDDLEAFQCAQRHQAGLMRRAGKIRDVVLVYPQDGRLRLEPAVHALHGRLPSGRIIGTRLAIVNGGVKVGRVGGRLLSIGD